MSELVTRTPLEQSLGFSIIIPTYNELENIEHVVTRCLDALVGENVELIVVDDSSPDGTADHAQTVFADDDRVQVIERFEDHGLAQSVTDGFRAARNDYCAVIDADLQHPPEKLPSLLSALESGADIAIGSRHVDGGGIENWSRLRKLISWGATKFARGVLPDARGISDPMSGFFAVRREVVDDVDLDAKGYKILLEILAKGDYEPAHVQEVPYVFRERERGESKLTASEYRNFVEHLMGLSFETRGLDRFSEPDRLVRGAEFASIGALGAIVNMTIFSGLTMVGGEHYLIAGAVAFLVALNFNFAGNWLFTFDRPNIPIWDSYAKFNAVSVMGFVAYSALLAMSVDVLSVPVLLANLIAIVGGFIVNFRGSESIAFSTTSSN